MSESMTSMRTQEFVQNFLLSRMALHGIACYVQLYPLPQANRFALIVTTTEQRQALLAVSRDEFCESYLLAPFTFFELRERLNACVEPHRAYWFSKLWC